MARDAGFGVIAERLGYQLHKLDTLAMAQLSEALDCLGLTPARATALFYVSLNPACDQVALGRALGVNRASTMALVNVLVALALLERRPGRNRRSNALYITAPGAVALKEFEQITLEFDEGFFSGLAIDERENLMKLLIKARRIHEPGAAITPKTQSVIRRVK